MAFPIIPVVATAGVAGLAALVFGGKKEKTVDPTKPSGVDIPQKQIEPPKANSRNTLPSVPRSPIPRVVLPKRGQGVDLPPRPAPAPIPSPTPIVPPSPIPGPSPVTSSVGYVTASVLNVRSAPNTSGALLTTVSRGSRVTVIGSKFPPTTGAPQGWYKIVTSNNVGGYASAEFISSVAPGPSPSPAPSPVPAPSNIPAGYGLITARSGANIRSGPTTSSQILQTKPFNSLVKLAIAPIYPPTAGAPKGWYQLDSSSGAVGYVSVELVQLGAGGLPDDSRVRPDYQVATTAPVEKTGTVTANGGLNIRSAPNTSGTVLATMPKGSKLAILEATGSWYKVRTSTNVIGYASAQYIQMDAQIAGEPYGDSYYHVSQVAGDDDYSKYKYSITG